MENTMAETNGAASSTAEETDVFGGLQPTMSEYSSYRSTGELPERFKSTAAVTDAPEETVVPPADDESEIVPDSDPDDAQEPKPDSPAQKRILGLLAEIKKLKADKEPQPVTPPAPAPQTQPATRQKPVIDAKDDKGNPLYASYEDYIEDLADWKSEQRMEKFKYEQAQQVQAQQLRAKIDEGKEIYGDDFGSVADNAAGVIAADRDVPQLIKQRIGRSDFLPHLVYTMTGDEGLPKFLAMAKSDPFKALDYIAVTENLIREELAKGGKGESEAPERKTTAPKPPSPVSGASSRAFDVSDESLSAEEWARKRNAQIAKKKA